VKLVVLLERDSNSPPVELYSLICTDSKFVSFAVALAKIQVELAGEIIESEIAGAIRSMRNVVALEWLCTPSLQLTFQEAVPSGSQVRLMLVNAVVAFGCTEELVALRFPLMYSEHVEPEVELVMKANEKFALASLCQLPVAGERSCT